MILTPSLTSTLLMWASGARHRIGVAGRRNDPALIITVNLLRDAVHHVDLSAALLAAFGVDLNRSVTEAAGARVRSGAHPVARSSAITGWGIWRPELFLAPAELHEGEAHWRSADGGQAAGLRRPGRRLVVNVSASSHERYWPEQHFITTIQRIRMRYPDVVVLVIGSPQDAARMTQIANGADAQVAYTPHYRQMMAIVASSDVVLTADTSVTHVASAFFKPAVVMFVGGGAALWGPYATPGHVFSTKASLLEFNDVDIVVQALESLIAAERSPVKYLPTARGVQVMSSP